MRKWFRFLLAGSALSVAVLAQAQVAPAVTEGLLRQSGIWEQVGSIGEQAEAGLPQILAQTGVKPSEAEIARLTQAIRASYAPARLRETLLKVVSGKLEARHVSELRRWYDAPLGQSITRIEERASADPGDYEAGLREGYALLEKMQPTRRQLLEELLRQTRAAEIMAQITINTSLASLSGVASVTSQVKISPSQLKTLLEAQRPQLIQSYAAVFLTSFARIYAVLPTEALQQYVKFLSSSAGHHFNAVCNEALDAALTGAASDLGRRLPSTRDQANT